MGIVAECPNGHRLKIKDQFAGKKVLCPQCQAPFRVVAEDAVEPAPAGLPVARVVPLDAAIVATLPRAYALDAPPAWPPQPAPQLVPPPAPAVAAAPAWHPLVAEQPAAMWSLALPGGDPTPPMAAAAMQQWLDSRQATGAELVWRSDWPDWLPIAQVFPEYMPAPPV